MTDAGPGPWVTKSGKVLTDADIQALAEEAERGYDVSHLIDKPNRRTLMADKIEVPPEPEVVLECDSCEWTYKSDGSIPDEVLEEILDQHRQAAHG